MRYIKGHLESIAGIEIYPIISLIIFFLFFVGLIFFVVFRDRNFIDYMKQAPLQLDDEKNEES